jgi:hypothetical protein
MRSEPSGIKIPASINPKSLKRLRTTWFESLQRLDLFCAGRFNVWHACHTIRLRKGVLSSVFIGEEQVAHTSSLPMNGEG